MNTDPLTIRVECYAGYPGEETPRRFFMGDKSIEIEEVIDRWLAPEYRYFKVSGGENDIYILRHDELAHRWELTMFQSGKYDGSPLSSTLIGNTNLTVGYWPSADGQFQIKKSTRFEKGLES